MDNAPRPVDAEYLYGVDFPSIARYTVYMDFAATLGITIGLWAIVVALAYSFVQLIRYIRQFKNLLLFFGLLFMWYIFAPHLSLTGSAQFIPDISACDIESSSACGDLAFASIFFLFPAIGMAMVAGHTRFGWFNGQGAPYDQDGETNEDDLGIMRRLIPREIKEKKEKHVLIFDSFHRTPKKVKICPVCKKATRCRIGINQMAGISFHTVRE